MSSPSPQTGRYYRVAFVIYPTTHHFHYMIQSRATEYNLASLNSRINDQGIIPQASLPFGVPSAMAWLDALLRPSDPKDEVRHGIPTLDYAST